MFDLNQFEGLEFQFGCFKGGGGSSSGKVGFPTYMETLHSAWLNSTAADVLTTSMVDAMESAIGSSPWTTLAAYDPAADITAWETAMTGFRAVITGLDDTVDWNALWGQANTSIDGVVEADIAADVAAFSNQLDDEIETKVLPRYRRGMQDINAVVSSAFPIGAALIESSKAKDVAKHSSGLRITLADKKNSLILGGTEQMIKMMATRLGLEDVYTKSMVESNRIKIVAKSEQAQIDAKLDESDALWDLEVFQHGGNLLGAIGSGVVKPKQASTAQSVLGGGMVGAGAGFLVGGPVGAVVGGVLGAASGLL